MEDVNCWRCFLLAIYKQSTEDQRDSRYGEMARIMIVEDETIVSKDIKNMLEELGHTVPVTASSGEKAIQEAGKHRPDLVLMDIKLKGEMDGIETAQQIQDRFHIPVIYLTAFAENATLQRAKISKPYGYVIKPFQENDLRINIEMALYKHKAERELERSEEMLRAVFESATDCIFVKDAFSVYVRVNPAMEKLFNMPADEIVGKMDIDLFGEEEAKTIMEEDLAVLQGNIIDEDVERVIDGTTHVFHTVKMPLKNSQGDVFGICGIARDVTERKKLEEDLAKIQRLESIGELAGGIAHNFNNILTAKPDVSVW